MVMFVFLEFQDGQYCFLIVERDTVCLELTSFTLLYKGITAVWCTSIKLWKQQVKDEKRKDKAKPGGAEKSFFIFFNLGQAGTRDA